MVEDCCHAIEKHYFSKLVEGKKREQTSVETLVLLQKSEKRRIFMQEQARSSPY